MKIKRFEKANRIYFGNRLLQTILFISACLMAWLIAWKTMPVFDISTNAQHSLTPETISYLQNLPTEVEIIGSLSLSEPSSLGRSRFAKLEALIRRYERISTKVKVRWVDGFRAQSEYQFKNPYQLLVRSANRNEWVGPQDLWISRGSVESFAGERIMTSAIWRVANPQNKRVVVYGSQEKLQQQGLASFTLLVKRLQQQGLEVSQISHHLSGISKADMVIFVGGLDYLESSDLAVVQRYLNDAGGSIMMALDEKPSEDVARFLYFNGVELNAYKVRQDAPSSRTPLGESLLSDFGSSKVVQTLKQTKQTLLSRGDWWVLSPRAGAIDRQIEPIVSLSANLAEGIKPVCVALSFQKNSQDRISQKGIVFGSSDFLSNAYLNYGGNQALLDASIDWLLDRVSFQSIPVRSQQSRQLSLTIVQLWKFGGVVATCCLVLAALGVIRLLTRPR